MSMQDILRIAGIALLVIAALFVILAIHYFVTNDIRGVMDDLSGKARARGVAGTRRATAASQSRKAAQARERAGAKAAKPQVTKGTVASAQAEAPQPEASQAASVAIDEDDMGTLVVDADFGAAPVGINKEAMGGSPAPGQGASQGTVAFRVTRTIILCDSDKIIAAGEGM